MRIILSPAKKMNVSNDFLGPVSLPVFLKETETILDWMKKLTFPEAQKLWACNEKIAKLNFERCEKMDLYRNLSPAILSYEGIAFQYMAPAVFEDSQFAYIQEHLRIFSGFYGVLRPLDGVTPYRLEMQAKTGSVGSGASGMHGGIDGAAGNHAGSADFAGRRTAGNLYDFWGDRLYREVTCGNEADRIIINLASKEYSRCIEKYLQPADRYITCVFGEMEVKGNAAAQIDVVQSDAIQDDSVPYTVVQDTQRKCVSGKIVQKGVYAKMARGEMVRFMAERQIKNPEEMKSFDRLGFRFAEELSSETEYVFLRQEAECEKEDLL